jgi:hypothetical protein
MILLSIDSYSVGDLKFWLPVTITSVTAIVLAIWNIKQHSKMERLKNKYKIQFETEFSIYRELWADIVELNHDLIILSSFINKDITDKNEFERIINKTKLSATALKNCYTKSRPFYSGDIFHEIDAIMHHTTSVILYQVDQDGINDENIKYVDDAIKQIGFLMIMINNAIRDRVFVE